jgi:hypothetical protein
VRIALLDLCGILTTIRASYASASLQATSLSGSIPVPFSRELESLATSVETQFAELQNKVYIGCIYFNGCN